MHLSLHLALDKLAEHTNSPRIKSDTQELLKPTPSNINGITRKMRRFKPRPTS